MYTYAKDTPTKIGWLLSQTALAAGIKANIFGIWPQQYYWKFIEAETAIRRRNYASDSLRVPEWEKK